MITQQQVNDHNVEFPSLDDRRVGRPDRYLYAVSAERNGGLIKYDTRSGNSVSRLLPSAHQVGEAVFVPAADTPTVHRVDGMDSMDSMSGAAAEDAGWLINIVTPRDGSASSLLVWDATSLASGPIATVRLPRRVPAGFHGSWIPEVLR